MQKVWRVFYVFQPVIPVCFAVSRIFLWKKRNKNRR